MMSVDQCKTHLLKMVKVLFHIVVQPQVYVNLIHNVIPKSHFHILIYVGRTILTCIVVKVQIHLDLY